MRYANNADHLKTPEHVTRNYLSNNTHNDSYIEGPEQLNSTGNIRHSRCQRMGQQQLAAISKLRTHSDSTLLSPVDEPSVPGTHHRCRHSYHDDLYTCQNSHACRMQQCVPEMPAAIAALRARRKSAIATLYLCLQMELVSKKTAPSASTFGPRAPVLQQRRAIGGVQMDIMTITHSAQCHPTAAGGTVAVNISTARHAASDDDTAMSQQQQCHRPTAIWGGHCLFFLPLIS
jgi:hypothetical protein